MNAWELIIQQPMINILIVLTSYLADSFGLAIIALTILVNLAMMPLTRKQMNATKVMQELQPKLAELQRKHAKDRQKLAQEQMRLYRESGMSPAGCMVPMLIQMPIWIALYQSVMLALAIAPEGFLNLSRYLYSWPIVFEALPLQGTFLGMDLGESNMILAFLVGGTMWVQQKMSTTVSSDPRQQQQARMMLWMMPMMFTFLALSFPSGLALFWVASSLVRIVMQYYATGWGGLIPARTEVAVSGGAGETKRLKFTAPGEKSADTGADIVVKDDGTTKGYPSASKKSRFQSGKDKGQSPKK